MWKAAALLLLAAAAHGAQQPGTESSAFLQAGQIPENSLEKVPVVGQQFKVHPVSTSMQCVISLTIQYMLVYTALAVARTVADVMEWKYENFPVTDILKTACITVSYAPMLAILFLACRMRVTWLTQGKGNPPVYVQSAMYCATYAVLLMTICVCVIPIFTGGKVMRINKKTGDLDPDEKVFESQIVGIAFTVLKYLIMLGLYIGAIVVVYGIITYEPPKGTWPGDVVPPVSPAVQCTTILAAQFFLVYAGIQICKSITDWSKVPLQNLEKALDGATNSMFFAPMLAVLFIGARMRALQMDPVNGAPQKWAQNCFFMCTYALALQTCLCIAIPLVLNGTVEKGEIEGDMKYKVEGTNAMIGGVLTVVRFLIMLCIYIGFSCVIYSVFTIEHPKGPQYTPPVSVTMKCVINLTVQFFTVYLLIWVAETIRNYVGTFWIVTMVSELMENAKATINFCPMLAILFVGTRMRALWLTNNRGAPQGWVQDGMYMATWAVLIQFLMVLMVGVTSGTKDMQIDEDGTPKVRSSMTIVKYVGLVLKWITFIFLYGGIITVIVGVYTMTPQTANGRGAVPLVGDGKVPGVDAKVPMYDGVEEPYGPSDASIPGVKEPQTGRPVDASSPGL